MAKPNYQFEKRQREQQKKLKKAEKEQRKANPSMNEPEAAEQAALVLHAPLMTSGTDQAGN